MRTAGVKKLVGMALGNLPEPYTENVIDEVFEQIENSPEYMAEYQGLCKELGKTTVNTWGGYWIASAVGKTGVQQTISKRNRERAIEEKRTLKRQAKQEKREAIKNGEIEQPDWLGPPNEQLDAPGAAPPTPAPPSETPPA